MMKKRNASLLSTICLLLCIVSCTTKDKETSLTITPGLFPVKEKSRYGYMNETGKIVVPPTFDYAWDISDGMGRFRENGKYGFIDDKGVVVIKPEFVFADDFKDGFARVNTTDTVGVDVLSGGYDLNSDWSFVDKKGVVFKERFARAEYLRDGYAQVKDVDDYDAPWTYVSLTNGSLIRSERNTEAIFSFNGHDLAPASNPETGKIGAINKLEEWVIPATFDAIEPFSEGLAAANKDNLYGYIDLKGNWVYQHVASISDYVYLPTDFRAFSNGMAVVKFKADSYGYINKEGKKAFNAKFRSASDFNADGYAIVSNDLGTGLIDRSGTFIVKPNIDILSVNHGVLIYRQNDSYGARDLKTQKEIVPAIYDKVEHSGDLLRVLNNGATYGYINPSGQYVVEPQFDLAWTFNNGKAIVQQGSDYFYVDKMGKVIGTVPPEYQPFYYKPSSEYYASMVEEKFGFSTAGGDSLVIPAEFDFATNFEGNIARVNIGAVLNEEQWEYSGGKWGLIDRSGKKIMPVENELILPFHNSLALFNVGGETTYRLCDGECSEPVQYSCVGGKWGILDPSGKVVIEAKYNSIVPFGNNFLVAEDSIYSLIDPSGNVIYPVKLTPEFPEVNDYGMVTLFEDEFVKASENGKVGILDRNGKWILPPQYDGVSVLSNVKSTPFKDGKVLVNIGGLWGVADESGSIVIPVAYENMRGFSEGLAPVRSNALWGFINEKNEMQIAPQFYAVRDFQGDVAIVQPRHDSEEGVINTSGKMLIAPKPGVTFDYKGFVHGLCLISATQHSEAVGYPVMTTGVVNSKGTVLFNQNELTDARIQPDGLLYVVKNGRWAIANHNGAMLSGYNYSWIEPYSGQALIRCNIGGTVTYNDYGEEEDAYGGRWGFIDRNGAVKIKFSFSEVGSFKDGLAPASTSDDLDEIGYVNRNGRFIRPVTK